MTALTQRDLNRMGCGTPDCGHDHTILYLNARCHPKAGTFASYDKSTGSLLIECAKCEKPIVEIAVNPGNFERARVRV